MNHQSTPESTKKKYELANISPDAKRGWSILVNGEEVRGVESVSIVNNALGMSVDYGMRPEGYDGFVIREMGGAVTLPWMTDEAGQIYVGLVEEHRPTMGEDRTLNAPRGMANAGESRAETARREMQEETGKDIGSRAVQVASGQNFNSTLFDNTQEHTGGVDIYTVKLATDELELDHDEEGNIFYRFPSDVAGTAENKVVEKIYGTKFIPVNEAFASKDMLTVTSVGLLMGVLLQNGNYIVPQKATFEDAQVEG